MTKNIRYALVSISQGSWKWQPRKALKSYKATVLKNGKVVWRHLEVINNRIKPNWRRTQTWVAKYNPVIGSLHNTPYESEKFSTKISKSSAQS